MTVLLASLPALRSVASISPLNPSKRSAPHFAASAGPGRCGLASAYGLAAFSRGSAS
jgi:hypothetical protein